MSSTRVLLTFVLAGATAGLTGCAAPSDTGNATTPMVMGNIITGEGFPNPAPNVQANWGQLPEGRMMGTSAGMALDPIDGNIWTYERCGSGSAGGPGINCDSNPVAPLFKFDRKTGAVLANIGAGVMVTPHGIHVDKDGNVWVTDFNNNEAKTKGQQVHKFSPSGDLLMSLGVAGQAGNDEKHFNQPNAVITAPDGSIFVADGHGGQGMLSQQAIDAGIAEGQTGRIMKFTADGTFVKQWGKIGTLHGEFRTPHAMAFDAQGRLWVADRGNKRIEIFDQDGNYLESRYKLRPHQRDLHRAGPDGVRDRLRVGALHALQLGGRRARRQGGQGRDHRLRAAVQGRDAALPGRGRRGHHGGRRRQHLRR